MLGLRLGDMPSGYTKPDGSKVPSGWDVYAAELGEALRSALVGSPALGVTARDVAKDLPIRLLHGGGHAAWLEAHGLVESHAVFPLMAQLEGELPRSTFT